MTDYIYRTDIHIKPIDEVLEILSSNKAVNVRSRTKSHGYLVSAKKKKIKDFEPVYKSNLHSMSAAKLDSILKTSIIGVMNGGRHNQSETGVFAFLMSEEMAIDNKLIKRPPPTNEE